jgi:formylglycine-generating enzyme required for sulfatase activity
MPVPQVSANCRGWHFQRPVHRQLLIGICFFLTLRASLLNRLPTEAEWEYACRAGTKTVYYFGDDPAKLGEYAWFDKNSGGHPRPVGQKKPNPWGLYDICGNLWEWCNDFYKVDYYNESPATDPKGPDAGQTKVVRGGMWRANADKCRSAYRYNENPGYADVCFGYDIYGFRCVRKPGATTK